MLDFLYASLGTLMFTFVVLLSGSAILTVFEYYQDYKRLGEDDLILELTKKLRDLEKKKMEWEVACDKLYKENEELKNVTS